MAGDIREGTLPQYVSSVQYQPAPVQSAAPGWEAVSQAAKHMQNEFATEQMKQDQLAIQANKYGAATALMNLSTSAKIAAAKNGDPAVRAKEYGARLEGGAKAILSKTYSANVPYVHQVLQYKIDEAHRQYAEAEAARARTVASQKFNETYKAYSNEMKNAAYNGNQQAALVFRGQLNNLINGAIKHGGLSAERGAYYQKQMEGDFRNNFLMGQYRNARNAGQGEQFKEGFMNGNAYNAWYDPKQKQAIMNQFSDIDEQVAAQHGVNQITYDQNAKQLVYDAQNGKGIDQGMMADLSAVSPAKFATTLEQVRQAQQQYQITAPYRNAPINTIKAGIAELENPATMPISEQDRANQIKAAQSLKTYLTDLNNDPAAVIEESQAFRQIAKNNMNSDGAGLLQTRIQYQQHIGIKPTNIRALRNDEAHIEVQNIVNSPKLQDQLIKFTNYVNSQPAQVRPYVVRDLQRAGLPLSTQYLVRMSSSPEAAQYALDAAQAWKGIQMNQGAENYTKAINTYKDMLQVKGIKMPDFSDDFANSDAYQEYANYILSSGGDVNAKLSDFKNHAELLSLQLMTKGKDPDEATNVAVKAMLAGTKIDTYKGVQYLHDAAIPNSNIEKAMDYMQHKAQVSKVIIPPRYSNAHPKLSHEELQDMYMANAHFITTPDQSGLIMVDENKSPVRTEDGKTIEFNWRDLKNPNSELMNEITALHVKRDKKLKKQLKQNISLKLMQSFGEVE